MARVGISNASTALESLKNDNINSLIVGMRPDGSTLMNNPLTEQFLKSYSHQKGAYIFLVYNHSTGQDFTLVGHCLSKANPSGARLSWYSRNGVNAALAPGPVTNGEVREIYSAYANTFC